MFKKRFLISRMVEANMPSTPYSSALCASAPCSRSSRTIDSIPSHLACTNAVLSLQKKAALQKTLLRLLSDNSIKSAQPLRQAKTSKLPKMQQARLTKSRLHSPQRRNP
jgi:hypothetical protein